MTKRLQIRMTKPIGLIARIASLNGAASVEGVTAGNIRPRRVHRGKSPVTGDGASRS